MPTEAVAAADDETSLADAVRALSPGDRVRVYFGTDRMQDPLTGMVQAVDDDPAMGEFFDDPHAVAVADEGPAFRLVTFETMHAADPVHAHVDVGETLLETTWSSYGSVERIETVSAETEVTARAE